VITSGNHLVESSRECHGGHNDNDTKKRMMEGFWRLQLHAGEPMLVTV